MNHRYGFLLVVAPEEDDFVVEHLLYYRRRAGAYDSDLYRGPAVAETFGAILDRLGPTGTDA